MKRSLFSCAASAALLLCLWSCSSTEQKVVKEARPAPVVAVPAKAETVPVVIKAVGNVEPLATVAIKPQVGGAIVAQLVADGAKVAKGDVLFRIDPRPFELSIRESQAKLERDKALLFKAEEDLKRYTTLKTKDVVAQGQYDETFAQAKTLDGTIKLNQATLERAKLDLEYAEVRAPIAGRVGAVLLTTGNVVKANEATACIINQINPIYISFSVPERYLPAIMARHKQSPLEITASPPGDLATEPVKAPIASVDNAVDTKTGTIRLKALAENADQRLWPGQFVRVSLTIAVLENAVVIPTQAVMDGVSGPYVYVIADGKAEARKVVPGPIVDGATVVDKGLAPGEMVVVDGQVRLAPGVKAEIKNPAETDDQAGAKPAPAKPADTKPADTKPADTKPADTKPADTKPADTKPAEAKPGDAKAAEPKAADAKAAEGKPAPAKPAGQGAKP